MDAKGPPQGVNIACEFTAKGAKYALFLLPAIVGGIGGILGFLGLKATIGH